MKKTILLLTVLFTLSITLMAQAPPSPPGTGNNGGTNGFVGGTTGSGAPVGSGTFILLAFAAAYAGHKMYVINRITAQD